MCVLPTAGRRRLIAVRIMIFLDIAKRVTDSTAVTPKTGWLSSCLCTHKHLGRASGFVGEPAESLTIVLRLRPLDRLAGCAEAYRESARDSLGEALDRLGP
jgi:hypothetical protein